ncbi:MAG: large subunit ribosomal protein [Solirubrobacteraceae bacterium]|jgi:ribosomal protein L22|nr:large subunit ribosomal protein [Solirubrobacteraceae bacterium]
MTPESQEPEETTAADAPSPEAARSEEPAAPARDETSLAASAEDVPASAESTETPQAEQEPESEAAADEAEAVAEPEAPKRARRPRRRRGAEASEATETEAADEPAATPAAPARPSQPAPTRRRSRREPGEPAPVVRAQAKYVRSSARKARLVCDHIRGKSVDEARAILAVTPRAIARDWSKLLESAVANAEHNHELVGEDLYVKAVHADEGPTIKRFRPRAMGRATAIRKRTSHLTILLTPKD